MISSPTPRPPKGWASLLLLALWTLTQGLHAAPDELSAPFPREFRPRTAKIHPITAPEGVRLAWETKHFRFFSDEPIPPDRLRRFATTMESVPQLLEALPLSLWTPPAGEKAVVRLCRDEEQFSSLGGPSGSSGFYQGRNRTILIRADHFLNPPRAGASRLPPAPNEDLLVHELCHLGMNPILVKANPWLYEGLAEYFAAAHQGGGSYRFDNMPQAIRDHFRRHLPRDSEGKIPLPTPASLETTTGREWIHANTHAEPTRRYDPYATALLMVHYQLEGGAERRATFLAHLRELQSPQVRPGRAPALKGEQAAVVQSRLETYWDSRGLPLRFY